LTRRVDARLMAISGAAGRLVARGEEAKNQIKDYTRFSTRKARVTEVSRALRQAAKEEYERRKQEHREWIAADKAEKAKGKEEDASKPAASAPSSPPAEGEVEPSSSASPQSPGKSIWKGKATAAGQTARTSMMGFVDLVKTKTRSKDDTS